MPRRQKEAKLTQTNIQASRKRESTGKHYRAGGRTENSEAPKQEGQDLTSAPLQSFGRSVSEITVRVSGSGCIGMENRILDQRMLVR